ncbi:MAG: bifunctional UDP-N-acetylglucosamine diphosphorylase/glucosamine-1-phosphate N-acetyltransferase GlmU [Rickettsiales bacterium]
MSNKAKTSSLSQRSFAVVVLAAGKGTRMRSNLPKVLHPLAGKPMLCHVLSTLEAIRPDRTGVVIAPGMDEVRMAARETCRECLFAVQDSEKIGAGTGAAVKAARDMLEGFAGDVLVLFGDTPLITADTLQRMLDALETDSEPVIAVLGMRPQDPAEYGRLVLNSRHELEEIVEFKDASPVQKEINLCNSGVMAIKGGELLPLLDKLENNNAKGEYYLTDMVKIARSEGRQCAVIEAPEKELLGVNSRDQLAHAEAEIQQCLRYRAMEEGATLIAPETVFFSHDTKVAPDVVIHPFVYFGPNVTLHSDVEIRSFSHIEGAVVSERAVIGPYARLRPGAEIGEAAHVGNFVEIKKATLEKGVKANHLSYIGDAHIGAHTNIGAGTITCNYDGFDKYQTTIGEGAFIGSNTALVAPVSVGDGAIIGAGSTIAEDVDANALAITRAQQSQKKDWAKSFRAGKRPTKKVN